MRFSVNCDKKIIVIMIFMFKSEKISVYSNGNQKRFMMHPKITTKKILHDGHDECRSTDEAQALDLLEFGEKWDREGYLDWSAIDNSYEILVVANSDCDFIVETETNPDTQCEYDTNVYLVMDENECITEYCQRKGITHLHMQDWMVVDDHLVPGDIIKYDEPVYSTYRGHIKCQRAVIAEVMSYKFGLARGRFFQLRILISWKCHPYPENDLRKRNAKTIEDQYQPQRLLWHNEQDRLQKIQQLEIEIKAYENDVEINAHRTKRKTEIENKHIAKQAGEIRRLLWNTDLHHDFNQWNITHPTYVEGQLNNWKIVTDTLDDILERDIILFGEVVYEKISSRRFVIHCLCTNIARILNLKKRRKGNDYVEIEILASTCHCAGVILLRKSEIIYKFDLYRHTWCFEHARMVEFSKIHKMTFASIEAYDKYVKTMDE